MGHMLVRSVVPLHYSSAQEGAALVKDHRVRQMHVNSICSSYLAQAGFSTTDRA
ncbi:hypothetical protein Mapa_005290 [Marchantia paleacea]|nr:hypothetical protein Mapa_005290 [Marchantia paleacea]